MCMFSSRVSEATWPCELVRLSEDLFFLSKNVPFFRLARLLQRNDWNPAGTMIILRNPSKNAITKKMMPDLKFKIISVA